MILLNKDAGTVKIVNDSATDYDWNIGGGSKRNTFIKVNISVPLKSGPVKY